MIAGIKLELYDRPHGRCDGIRCEGDADLADRDSLNVAGLGSNGGYEEMKEEAWKEGLERHDGCW